MQNRKNNKYKSRLHAKFADIFSVQNTEQGINHKRGLRASGLSLLPLALRPLLFNIEKLCNLIKVAESNILRFSKYVHLNLKLAVLSLSMLLGIFIIQNSYINSVSAKSVTLTIPSDPLTLTVTPGQGSVFKKSSAGTISVATDSSYGYTLSIQSKTSNDLLNGSNKIASIVSALSEEDYESSGDVNTWGYLPSKLGGSINTDFQPGPTTEPTTLDRIESSSEGTDYGLTLATKIDSSLPAGNYSNTFVLSATSNDPPYDDIMQNWSGCEDLPKETQTLNLLDTRDNKIYTVAKLADGQCWMTKNLEIGKEDKEMTLTSDTSDTAGDFTLLASSDSPNADNAYDSREIHLDPTYGGYYTWYTATAGEGTQDITTDGQNMEHSICPKGWRLPTKQDFIDLDKAFGGTGANGQSSSTNVSDGKTLLQMYQDEPAKFLMGGNYNSGTANNVGNSARYWSSTAYGATNAYDLYFYSSDVYPQLNYGKYYMFSVRCVSRSTDPTMQNVEKWGDSVSAGQTVTTTDVRDNKEYTVARLADNKLWMTKNLEIENYNLTSSDSDVSSSFTLPASSTSGFSANDTSNVYVDSTYGGYYTWYAATAGEGTQSKSSGEVSHSICPKGWRLPTHAESSSLIIAQGSAKMTQSPANFRLGGYYSSGSAYGQGSSGLYWSSTAGLANGAGTLHVNSSSASTGSSSEYFGYSIRCVARSDDPTMQNVEKWGDSVTADQTVTATDTRDGKQYTVSRLADGKLWMTQNLALGKEESTTELTSADSDVSSNFTLPASSKSEFNDYDVSNVYVNSTYGGYYTWYAATAGEGLKSKSSGDTSHSICPKGWRLPTKSEFDSLVSAQGVAKMTQSPANFRLGGYYSSGSAINQGSSGSYWSSTAVGISTAYILSVNSSSANSSSSSESNGHPVRCVSRIDDPIQVGTMQTVDQWKDSVKQGKTAISKDSRDNTEYTVARLADGNLWMTKNLKLGKSTAMTLTSSDSDVSSNFTLPASSTSGFSSNTATNVYVDSTYGGYYTWIAATAGTGSSVSTQGQDATGSICPKGWRLPTKAEFDSLVSAQGSAKMTQSPANFQLSGYYLSGSPGYQGSSGSYWSSTAYSTTYAYLLSVNSSSAYTSNYHRGLGYSVRCVAQ